MVQKVTLPINTDRLKAALVETTGLLLKSQEGFDESLQLDYF